MFDLKPLFFVFYRQTADFRYAEDSQGNRHPKQKFPSVRELPTQFRQGGSEKIFAQIPPPVFGKGCSEFRGQKPHSNGAF